MKIHPVFSAVLCIEPGVVNVVKRVYRRVTETVSLGRDEQQFGDHGMSMQSGTWSDDRCNNHCGHKVDQYPMELTSALRRLCSNACFSDKFGFNYFF